MGLILDSSVVITAERRGYTLEQLIEQVVAVAGDQDAALSSVGLTELIHGIYRAQTPDRRMLRQSFIGELLRDLTVYPYTKETAMLAGKIDGEQQAGGGNHPLRGPAHRSDRALPWLLRADGQSAALQVHPRPCRRPVLSHTTPLSTSRGPSKIIRTCSSPPARTFPMASWPRSRC